MKTIFIITSCLIPAIGIFSKEERLKQTLETVDSIRNKSPESIVILSDVSIEPLDSVYEELISKVDLFLDLSSVDLLSQLTKNGMKSHGECVMTNIVINYLLSNPSILTDVKRIFKITGRLQLDDGFTMEDYEPLSGKYVFKKCIPTWMSNPVHGATHVFDTRLWSMCTSLIETHNKVLENVFPLLNSIDLEHAYYACLDKEKVVEFEKVHCRGQVASTGEWKFD
jgi:hypothetical protein